MAIDAVSLRLLALGFRQTARSNLLLRAKRHDGCEIEFVGERYGDQMTVSISGEFSDGEGLVLVLLAKAVSNGSFVRIRNSKTTRETIEAVLDFLDSHLDAIVECPEPVLVRYRTELSALVESHKHGGDESAVQPKQKGGWHAVIRKLFR